MSQGDSNHYFQFVYMLTFIKGSSSHSHNNLYRHPLPLMSKGRAFWIILKHVLEILVHVSINEKGEDCWKNAIDDVAWKHKHGRYIMMCCSVVIDVNIVTRMNILVADHFD